MHEPTMTYLQGQVVEEDIHLTLAELCHTCGIAVEHVTTWVVEGVLEPIGQTPQEWQFGGASLRRARLALRLSQDLEINVAGVALALDLLDEIDELRRRLARRGRD